MCTINLEVRFWFYSKFKRSVRFRIQVIVEVFLFLVWVMFPFTMIGFTLGPRVSVRHSMTKQLPGHLSSVPTLNISYPPSLVSPVCFANSFRYRFGKWMEAKHSAWRWLLASPWRRCHRQECFFRRNTFDWFRLSWISVLFGIFFLFGVIAGTEMQSTEKKSISAAQRTLSNRIPVLTLNRRLLVRDGFVWWQSTTDVSWLNAFHFLYSIQNSWKKRKRKIISTNKTNSPLSMKLAIRWQRKGSVPKSTRKEVDILMRQGCRSLMFIWKANHLK